jgi:hypothetical protein
LTSVIARCGSREAFVAGGGGWVTDGIVVSMSAGGKTQAKPRNFEVRGTNPDGGADALFAQALCLPK